MKTACGREGVLNQSREQQRPRPWCSGAPLGCTAVTQEGWGAEKSDLLLEYLVVLAACRVACVRTICLNRRCLANAFGFTEISVFPVLLGTFVEPPLPVPPAGRAGGKHSPASG